MLRTTCILFSAVFLFAHQANAEPNAAKKQYKNEFTVDLSHYYYEEPNFMNDTSDPAFISVGLRNWNTPEKANSKWHFLYTTEITYGQVDYSSSGTGTGGSDYYKFRAEGYAGYKLKQFTPFIGLGYRWLYDDGGGTVTTTGALGYDRRSQYVYVPLGGIFNANEKLRFKGQFNYLLAGLQTSYLSNIAGFSDVDNEQHSGWGFDLTADYKITDRTSIYSFYRYWDIGISEVAVGSYGGVPRFLAWEPANTTREVGIGIAYAF